MRKVLYLVELKTDNGWDELIAYSNLEEATRYKNKCKKYGDKVRVVKETLERIVVAK